MLDMESASRVDLAKLKKNTFSQLQKISLKKNSVLSQEERLLDKPAELSGKRGLM